MAALCVCCLGLTSGAVILGRMRADAAVQEGARQAPTAVPFSHVVPEWRHGQFVMFESMLRYGSLPGNSATSTAGGAVS